MIEIKEYNDRYFEEVSSLLNEFRVVLQSFKDIKASPDIASAKEELKDYIKEKWPIYVALDNSKPIGYILLKEDGVVWVEHIYVKEEVSFEDVKVSIYNKAEEYSTKLGCDTLFNWVHPNNDKIVAFLKAKGYSVLNMIELRKPFKGETPSKKIKVNDNEFDY